MLSTRLDGEGLRSGAGSVTTAGTPCGIEYGSNCCHGKEARCAYERTRGLSTLTGPASVTTPPACSRAGTLAKIAATTGPANRACSAPAAEAGGGTHHSEERDRGGNVERGRR